MELGRGTDEERISFYMERNDRGARSPQGRGCSWIGTDQVLGAAKEKEQVERGTRAFCL